MATTVTRFFLYKEDFNKFIKALTEAVDYVKTELMPDFDFDAYNHDEMPEGEGEVEREVETNRLAENNGIAAEVDEPVTANIPITTPTTTTSSTDEVDKW